LLALEHECACHCYDEQQHTCSSGRSRVFTAVHNASRIGDQVLGLDTLNVVRTIAKAVGACDVRILPWVVEIHDRRRSVAHGAVSLLERGSGPIVRADQLHDRVGALRNDVQATGALVEHNAIDTDLVGNVDAVQANRSVDRDLVDAAAGRHGDQQVLFGVADGVGAVVVRDAVDAGVDGTAAARDKEVVLVEQHGALELKVDKVDRSEIRVGDVQVTVLVGNHVVDQARLGALAIDLDAIQNYFGALLTSALQQ
jgi:hypothetical protein